MHLLIPLVLAAMPAQAPSAAPDRALPNAFYAMDTCTNRPYVEVRLTPVEQLDLLKELGYAGLSWNEAPAAEITDLLALARQRELKVFAIYCAATMGADGTLKPTARLDEILEALRGSDAIVWLHIGGKGPSISSLEPSAQAVDALRVIADRAGGLGLKVAIYPHVGEWTERVEDAVRLAQLVDRPNFGVTYNLCHSLATGDEARLLDVVEHAGPFLMNVTINGADAGVGRPEWPRLIQTLDRGSFDVAAVLHKLDTLGYRGPIGLQAYGIGGDPRQNLERSMAAWRRLSASAARPVGR